MKLVLARLSISAVGVVVSLRREGETRLPFGVAAEPAVGAPKVVVRIGGSAELPAGSLDDAGCMTQCRLQHTR